MGRRQLQREGGETGLRARWRYYRKRSGFFRILLASLALVAIVPPMGFHFRPKSLHRVRQKKCCWLSNPPLVCSHDGDTTTAFPNTMAAYQAALCSLVDCMEVDVSRTADGVVVALHDRDLQQISVDATSRVGHYSMEEIKVFEDMDGFSLNFDDMEISSMEEALMEKEESFCLDCGRFRFHAVNVASACGCCCHEQSQASSTTNAGYANTMPGGWISVVSCNLNQRTSITRHSSNGSWDGGLPDFRIVRYD